MTVRAAVLNPNFLTVLDSCPFLQCIHGHYHCCSLLRCSSQRSKWEVTTAGRARGSNQRQHREVLVTKLTKTALHKLCVDTGLEVAGQRLHHC
jgi:hypothetical protein